MDLSLDFRGKPELYKRLKEESIIKKYKPGDIILQENAYIKSIPLIVKGSIRVFRSDTDGKEILLYYIKSGETCIMSFLGGLHNQTSKVKAEAEEEVEIYFLPMDKVSQFMKEYPEWLNFIFKMYHKRFEELLEVINAVTFKKVDQRLLLLLNKKVELTDSTTLSLTHEQLANELGTARVVVSRLLKQLEEEGKLLLGRNKLVVLKKGII